MAFSVSSVNRDRVPEDGGHEIEITGVFEAGHGYEVYVGDTGSISDYPAYSGRPGQGNVVYPRQGLTVLRCYTPRLPPGYTVSITIKDKDSPESHKLTGALVVDYQQFRSTVFGMRKVFPIFYKIGPRDLSRVPPTP